MNRRHFLYGAGGAATAAWAAAAGTTLFGRSGGRHLLNASYDATRELYRRVNAEFARVCQEADGVTTRVRPSHGGSGSQARAVIDGMPADVVTLALWPDTDKIREAGLIDAGWETRFPNRSCPYTSTIVFAVRRGNPCQVRDWPDLVSNTRPDGRPIGLVTANPKTSGAAKLGLLAAYGAVTTAGGSAADAADFVRAVFRRVPALESSSRAASVSFARKRLGDVQITWESEAWVEKGELGDDLEIVYPSRSVLAEPHVAVVDQVARRNGTEELARRYVDFLYTPPAQQIIADQYLRPSSGLPTRLGEVPHLFRVMDVVAGGWKAAQKQFFADGGLFDQIYSG